MAFQDVNQQASKEAVKLTGLKIGDTVTGFVVGFRESKQNPENQNILMREENGEGTFYVYTAGNVKYLIKDGKIKSGLLTKIERIADKMVGGKKSSQFRVMQDPSQTIDDANFNAITPSSEDHANEKVARQASVETAIKKHADKLASSMAGNTAVKRG